MTVLTGVRQGRDMGRAVWDAWITASQLHSMWKQGLLVIDPEKQRGKNSVTGKEVIKAAKVEKWTRDLLDDDWVCGQLTWNFRTGETEIRYDPDEEELVIADGVATIPDSGHRHRVIVNAVDSIEKGSSFDPNHPFSLRIWHVPTEVEGIIFYKMNQEADKADATRSKWLAQQSEPQKLARQVVRMSKHLTDRNVEVVTNNLSKKNPRLVAFNTVSGAFEAAWADVMPSDIDDVAAWFIRYWDELVEVLPELKRLELPQRQKVRRESLVGSAIAVQGYIRMARTFYDEDIDYEVLGKLRDKHVDEEDGETYDFFDWHNPLWQRIGIVSPSVDKQGQSHLRLRNSHQSRRAMTGALLKHLELSPR